MSISISPSPIIISVVGGHQGVRVIITFVCFPSIFQAYEDWLRHKADNDVNNRQTYVVRNGVILEVKSHQIMVSRGNCRGRGRGGGKREGRGDGISLGSRALL